MGYFEDSTLVTATDDHLATELDEEVVILDSGTDTYYGLNTTGKQVWQLIQEPRTVAEIRDHLVSEYDIDPDRCERDLQELLEKLREKGLIEISHG